MIKIKRAYAQKSKDDGVRILIDGLWPRGVSKEELAADVWLRQIAPTPGLRKWFHHDPKKFPEFAKRYKQELEDKEAFLKRIKDMEKEHGTVTLLFGARDVHHNNAVVLQDLLK